MPSKEKKRGGTRRDGKSSRRRRDAEVLEAAISIFNQHGYASTSVGDIAESLGILKGSLYYYIDSKEDLLFEIVDGVHEDVSAILLGAIDRDDLAPLERLVLYIHDQAEYNARNVASISVYYHDLDRLSADRLKKIRSRQASYFRSLVGLIEEVKKEDEIHADVDPVLAAHAVLGTIIWIYTWYKPRGSTKLEDLVDFCVGFAMGGMSGFRQLPVPGGRAGTPAPSRS